MKIQELKVGDIIVITDRDTKNYLQIGRVKEICLPDDDNIEEEIIHYKKFHPYYTRDEVMHIIKVRKQYQNKSPYTVEFNLPRVTFAGEYSSSGLSIDTTYYDKTLSEKCRVLYREEE